MRRYLSQVRQHKVGDPEFDIWEKFYPTLGPKHRFGAILFIEKEGFMPLFEEVQLAERYDLAIMSTKGMSVTASRELVDQLCAVHAVPLLVLHDFDKAGFSIVGTLRRSTRRYRFGHGHAANVIDLGLRLEDVDGLETEDVHFESAWKARENLRENGATDEEIDFLIDRARRAERLRVRRIHRMDRGQAPTARHRQGGAGRRYPRRRLPAHAEGKRWSRRRSTKPWPKLEEEEAEPTVPDDLSTGSRNG